MRCLLTHMILRRVGLSHRNSLKSGEKAAPLAYFARGSTDTDITVELDAEAVTDVPGNGIDAVSSIVNRHSILTPDRRAQLPPP